MKRFFATRREAKKALEEFESTTPWKGNIHIFDLKKDFPERKKRRFFVGSELEFLNI